jgi:flagellar hook-associated protein 2
MQGLSTFDGIASGLNTTELVDAIITAERAPARLLEYRQEQKTTELTTFSSLEALLLALRTEASRLARASTFDVSAFTVSDNTVLDASSPGLVPAATYDIEVRKLAQAHQIASQGFGSMSDVVGSGEFTIQVGQGSAVTVTLTGENNTLADLKDAINAAGAGVNAAIINDGSRANAYRLVLTGDKSGIQNRITVSSSLTGGTAPDFASRGFDTPETLVTDPNTSAGLALGATASYAGAENKIFTFTVQGSGSQTVGQGEITVEWSDGTNSGTILVSQADTEVTLVGTGADGLKVSFSAGELHAGDIFQVQTYTPELQVAQDAEIAVGTAGGGGSPIVLRGDSNTLTGALPGLTLALKKTTAPGEKVTVSAGPATEKLKEQIRAFVEKYNGAMEAIDKQFAYNEATKEVGTLIGDSSLLYVQSRLRNRVGSVVQGLSGELRMLSALGIRSDAEGLLKIDESKLSDKLAEDWEAVRSLFSKSGLSSAKGISFVSASADTVSSETGYDVQITRAATQGYLQGKAIVDPEASALTLVEGQNTLTITADGVTSDALTLAAKTYSSGAELALELQTKIDNDENLSGRNLAVEFVGDGATGHLKITSSAYGSSSTVSVEAGLSGSAADLLGLSGAASVNGLDVEGTIGGEAATGRGQILTGDDDNAHTAGLVLRVELTEADLVPGIEGTVTYTQGVAAALDTELDLLTNAQSGFLAARRKGLEAQIADLTDQIERFDARLLIRREALLKKFLAMEEAIGQFQNQSSYLTSAIAALNTNFQTIRKNSQK